jgi:TusA-related sulfurtransferase
MQIIDTSGQKCPAPLIATKRALRDPQVEDFFQVLTDSQNALNNISRFLTDNKTEFSSEESNGIWILTIRKKTSGNIPANTEE